MGILNEKRCKIHPTEEARILSPASTMSEGSSVTESNACTVTVYK